MYATKFLPVTNTKGARLKWWVTNSMLEKIGEAPAMQWSYQYDSQREELQYRLGSGFTVLRQHEALKAIENAHGPTFIVSEQTYFLGQDAGSEIRYAGQDRAAAKKIYDALKAAGVQVFAETKFGALTLDNDF